MRFPIWQAARLAAKLAVAVAALRGSRKRALQGFRQGLAEMGLPEDAIRELSRSYPALSLKGASPRSPVPSRRRE